MTLLKGKIIVVTGASSGVGAAAAKKLFERGAQVIPVGRSIQRTEKIAKELGVKPYTADFTDLNSVKSLANQLLNDFSRIDVLANNAGGIPTERGLTVDGNEPIFQVNTLSPFLLTLMLTPHLKKNGRIVNTSSRSHKGATINKSDWQKTNGLRAHAIYARSKLITGMLFREYHRRYSIEFADFHPGLISSDFGRYMGFYANILKVVFSPFLATPEKGAETLVYLAETSTKLNGDYYVRKQKAQRNRMLDDPALSAWLWEECMQRLGKLL
ncbi:SDR family NAD(P)-dependent oxidoreductase [Paenibacillus jiagnxiensis]|uniref:SDR family NAD(P)-dependent oxidoreductase n=1 Tax=Paenibacillus jiagnxiensis TaxID=3228926 RepID=UPI0033AD1EB8